MASIDSSSAVPVQSIAFPTPSSTPEERHHIKLSGRAFYQSLGSPKFILAPMVDQSEFAWRMLTRSFMNKEHSSQLLGYSPMFHARLFRETCAFRDAHFQPTRRSMAQNVSEHIEASDMFLDGNVALDRPLFVQFCANEPTDLLAAAEYVAPFCDAVDLNLGCPQNIAKRGNYGAFLQEDWPRIRSLISTLHDRLSVPVTAKFRILETPEKTLEYAKMILSAGASIITVHGRQRDQKGHKTGLADWSVIRYLRDNLPPDTVIFANGNILQHEDIERCINETGVDGVMSAEGNLSDPTIFSEPPSPGHEGREYWSGRTGKGGYRVDAVFRRYLSIIYKYVLEKPEPSRMPLFVPGHGATHSKAAPAATNAPTIFTRTNKRESESSTGENDDLPHKKARYSKKQARCTNPNLISMQAHLFALLRPLVSEHHDVRDALARVRAGDIDAFERILALTEEVVKQGLEEYEAHPEQYEYNYEETTNEIESSTYARLKCRRPWWVCQAYVRPLPSEALQNGSLTLSKKEKAALAKTRCKPSE